MGASEDVRGIRERAMERMRSAPDASAAVGYALAGLWDAVEVLTRAMDDEELERLDVRADLDRVVRSLPTRALPAPETDDERGGASADVAPLHRREQEIDDDRARGGR